MAKRPAAPASPSPVPDNFRTIITAIQVKGYKSLVDAIVTVRPLTLLAGTNSSGKSSIMQPLLLIKQTLQASYQTGGALLLDGPHLQVTSAEQVISKVAGQRGEGFSVRLDGDSTLMAGPVYLELHYEIKGIGFHLAYQTSGEYGQTPISLRPQMSETEILSNNPKSLSLRSGKRGTRLAVGAAQPFLLLTDYDSSGRVEAHLSLTYELDQELESLIHIPGLRTAPKRSYPAAAYQAGSIRGTFDAYTAGLIQHWQQQSNRAALDALTSALQSLGLTSSVEASTVNANELEVKVGRLPVGVKTRKKELVNIADVGFGVSQVLPVVVALIAATPGQLVYIEQPELHLHPRAQVQMAHLLADAARRGVRVIVETHSSLILLTIQTLVAEAKLSPEEVALHWFARDATGATQITLAEVDENGAYGPWPEDFGDVELTAQGAYLDAVARRQAGTQG